MNLLDKATSFFQKQLPFVLYAKPNETILHGIFQNDERLNVFENQSGFVFASFYNEINVVFSLQITVFPLIESFVQMGNEE